MASTEHIVDFQESLWFHLLDNLPTGYTSSDVINIDCDKPRDIGGKKLVQNTVVSSRDLIAAGGKAYRTFFIHKIQCLVKDNRADKKTQKMTVQELITAFEATEFNGLYLQQAEPEIVGLEPDTNLYRVDVNVNGYFEGR